MAESRFDRDRCLAGLATRTLGRTLTALPSTGSTNDDVWSALAAGGPDGLAVVADEQNAGRGRAGRSWTHGPGQGLALSVGLRLGAEAQHAGLLPLAAGLAVAEAIAELGVPARLKWPNDVLARGRKLAGVLCELRRSSGGEAVVVGVGLNVRQRDEDFPAELKGAATSLAREGCDAAPEDVAARVLEALERWRESLRAGDRATLLAAWSERAAFWGEPVTVVAPSGPVHGVAQRLDPDGALVLRLDSGVETVVLAGDLLARASDGAGAR